MFRLTVLFVVLAVALGFAPIQTRMQSNMRLQMSADKSIAKAASGLLLSAAMFAAPAFAKEGASPNFSFFGDSPSSPFSLTEKREDPIYSPYSPYGNGEKAVYTKLAGGKEEITFWTNQFNNCVTRTENVPKELAKKQWMNINTELTSYAYNMREAMLRLAASSKDPTAATAAAKTYFVDINDVIVNSIGHRAEVVESAYAASVKDLAAFKALIK